ncbi:cyclic pyranopterin monophosphate synthase MoaC, partial [uncultured Novosphingobium sp.]
MSTSLTHIDGDGTARMVDVGAKAETQRLARASGRIRMDAEALAAIKQGDAPKGDVLGTARIAGIMAAKRTGDLIPMCHPLAIDAVNLDFAFEADAIRATATATLTGKTGIEMEAITAVTIALVTIYDMAKALDKAMVIEDVRLIEKRG